MFTWIRLRQASFSRLKTSLFEWYFMLFATFDNWMQLFLVVSISNILSWKALHSKKIRWSSELCMFFSFPLYPTVYYLLQFIKILFSQTALFFPNRNCFTSAVHTLINSAKQTLFCLFVYLHNGNNFKSRINSKDESAITLQISHNYIVSLYNINNN